MSAGMLAANEHGVPAALASLSLSSAGDSLQYCGHEVTLSLLPNGVLALIFRLLPVDERLRCREVCTSWRVLLSDPDLWRVCDLSRAAGVVAKQSGALLSVASALARGRLLDLNAEHCERLSKGDLAAAAASNSDSLKSLRAWGCAPDANAGPGWRYVDAPGVRDILAAAPLCSLQLDVSCRPGEAEALLATKTLAVQSAYVNCYDAQGDDVPMDVVAVAAAAAAHPSLTGLRLRRARLGEETSLNTLVTLAINQLRILELTECGLTATALPALARLLAVGSLDALVLEGDGRTALFVGVGPAVDSQAGGAGCGAFCAALRCSRLRRLGLRWLRLWHSLADGLAVAAAAADAEALRELDLKGNPLAIPIGAAPAAAAAAAATCAAVGASLGRLLAPASSLQFLSVEACYLRDSLAPLFEALPGTTTLRALDVSWNDMPQAFARDLALPAVRANGSLRELSAFQADRLPEMEEAMSLVRKRHAADET
jgi:hypothetical protein